MNSILHRSLRNTVPAGPVGLVVLQGTSLCNLNCSYCYLTEASRRTKTRMPIGVIQTVLEAILSSEYLGDGLHISWHSGEPLVLGPDYYAEAIESVLRIRDRYLAPTFQIKFDIQTNGTLIDQRWCDFFKKHRAVLHVGMSCDGPREMHDANRLNWAGGASHRDVVRGMELMRQNGLLYDVIAVVSSEAMDAPADFIAFFAHYRTSIREFHFNLFDEFEIKHADSEAIAEYARRYRHFVGQLLDAYDSAVTPLPTRNFSALFRILAAGGTKAAALDARSMSQPLRSLTVDTVGNVSTFYAGLTGNECGNLYNDGRGLIVGNLVSDSLKTIASSPKVAAMYRDFEISHQACESACSYHSLCSGGYNLVKYKRFGTFDANETPECRIHVKTFVDATLSHIQAHVAGSGQPGPVIKD